METIRKATSPDQIPGYDKAYWHAKTPQERLDTALALNHSCLTRPGEDLTVHKFRTAEEWQAFKQDRRQKQPR